MSQKTSELYNKFVEFSDKAKSVRTRLSIMQEYADSGDIDRFNNAARYFAADVVLVIDGFVRSQPDCGLTPMTNLEGEFVFLKNAYNSWKKICAGEWKVSPCFLEFYAKSNYFIVCCPHIGTTDNSKIACYRDYADISRDRIMLVKPARWFAAFMSGSEHDGLIFNNKYISLNKQGGKTVHFLSDLKDGTSADNWDKLYRNTHYSCNSCMTKCPDVARVYSYDDALDAVYMTEDNRSLDENPNAVIIGRSIVRKDWMTYVRIYYNSYTVEEYIKTFLTQKNFEHKRDMSGIKLSKIPYENSKNKFVFPYVDGGPQGISDQGDYFFVEPESRTYEDDDDGFEEGIAFYADNPSGIVQIAEKCKKCGNPVHDPDDERVYLVMNENGELLIEHGCTWCPNHQNVAYIRSGINSENVVNKDEETPSRIYYADLRTFKNCSIILDRWSEVDAVLFEGYTPSGTEITCKDSLIDRLTEIGETCKVYTASSQTVVLYNGEVNHLEWSYNPARVGGMNLSEEEVSKCWISKDSKEYGRFMQYRWQDDRAKKYKNLLVKLGMISGEIDHSVPNQTVSYICKSGKTFMVYRKSEQNTIGYHLFDYNSNEGQLLRQGITLF